MQKEGDVTQPETKQSQYELPAVSAAREQFILAEQNDALLEAYVGPTVDVINDSIFVFLRPIVQIKCENKIKSYKNNLLYYGNDGRLTTVVIFNASEGITSKKLPVEAGILLEKEGFLIKKTFPYRVRSFIRNTTKRLLK